jgi:two-component system response regulator YesN
LDIGLIAEEVGYQNNGYFYKVFKKQVGVSPRVYREQERQIKA